MEPHASPGELLRRFGAPFLLLAVGLFAYRSLFDYDPFRDPRNARDETEAFFFSVRGGSTSLVFGISGLLLFLRRHRILASLAAPGGVAGGVALLAAALGLLGWSRYAGAPDLAVVSLTCALLGAGALLGGGPGLRAVSLPALFLLFLVPLPAVLSNQILFALQLQTAVTTAWILDLFGIPTTLMADRIFTVTGSFRVVETCSGSRTIGTLSMSAIVYAELFRRRGLHTLLLVAAAPLIGLLCNQARVLSLVFHPSSPFALAHTAQGLVMLVAGVCALAGLDALLARALGEAEGPRRRGAAAGRPFPALSPRFAGLLALLAAMGGLGAWVTPPAQARPTHTPLFSLEPRLGGWAARGLPLDREFLGTVGFREWVHREYTRGEDSVEVFVGADDHRDRRFSLRSAKTGRPGSGYALESRRPIRLEPEPGGPTAEVSVFASPEGRWLVYHWYEGVRPVPEEAIRALLALDRIPRGPSARSFVIRLTTRIHPGLSGLADAEERIGSLLPLIREQVAALRAEGSEALRSADATGR